MVRTQISFDEAQMQRLRPAARSQGVSMAAVVRAAVEREIGAEETSRQARMARALKAFDRGFRSGHHDISSRRDEHLAEIDFR